MAQEASFVEKILIDYARGSCRLSLLLQHKELSGWGAMKTSPPACFPTEAQQTAYGSVQSDFVKTKLLDVRRNDHH